MKKFLSVFTILASMMLLFSSCTKNDYLGSKDKLLGKWETINSTYFSTEPGNPQTEIDKLVGVTYTFYANGSCVIDIPSEDTFLIPYAIDDENLMFGEIFLNSYHIDKFTASTLKLSQILYQEETNYEGNTIKYKEETHIELKKIR